MKILISKADSSRQLFFTWSHFVIFHSVQLEGITSLCNYNLAKAPWICFSICSLSHFWFLNAQLCFTLYKPPEAAKGEGFSHLQIWFGSLIYVLPSLPELLLNRNVEALELGESFKILIPVAFCVCFVLCPCTQWPLLIQSARASAFITLERREDTAQWQKTEKLILFCFKTLGPIMGPRLVRMSIK